MATIGQQLLQPEVGWKRYDDINSNILYFDEVKRITHTSYYNGTGSGGNSQGFFAKFKFNGTKLRIIDLGTNINRTKDSIIKIDGVDYPLSITDNSTAIYNVLVFEVMELEKGNHNVEIINNDENYIFIDAIDIDSDGRLLHPTLEEVFEPEDLDIGKVIRCHYTATSNQVGAFSGLGEETSDLIPLESSATPNGDFYFIHTGYDYLGRMKLVADRNIQHSISWDTLNTSGIVSGTKLDITKIIPKMSSDILPTPFVASSSSIAGSGTKSYKAFDNDDTTFWRNLSGTFPHWLSIDIGQSKKVVKYLIQGGTVLNRVPKVWEVLGSNDNVSWDTLTTVDLTSNPMIESELRSFALDNTNFYRHYKLNVLQSNGDSSYVDIVKWQLLEKETVNYNLSTRLITGGIKGTDIINEWDKIIVNSDLNGTITAGDDNVWHWNISKFSWTSTTSKDYASGDYRVARGYSSGVDFFSSFQTTKQDGYSCFRPVLLVEILNQPPKISNVTISQSNIWYNDVDGLNLSFDISDPDGDQVQFQVLVNDVKAYPSVTDYTALTNSPTSSGSISIPTSAFTQTINTIAIVVIDSAEGTSQFAYNILKEDIDTILVERTFKEITSQEWTQSNPTNSTIVDGKLILANGVIGGSATITTNDGSQVHTFGRRGIDGVVITGGNSVDENVVLTNTMISQGALGNGTLWEVDLDLSMFKDIININYVKK